MLFRLHLYAILHPSPPFIPPLFSDPADGSEFRWSGSRLCVAPGSFVAPQGRRPADGRRPISPSAAGGGSEIDQAVEADAGQTTRRSLVERLLLLLLLVASARFYVCMIFYESHGMTYDSVRE